MRRIIGRSILIVISDDIQKAAGSLQLCGGQDFGIEAAIHAMHQVYAQEETEGVIMADAANAFNNLNRNVAIRNIRHQCPSLAAVVINSYRRPSNLYVAGECILSQEGTTQGDPLAMPFYALGILPLVRAVATPDTCQLWYADDSSAGGRLVAIRSWWDKLQAEGPSYGYHLNARKSVLVVKPHAYDDAVRLFADTGIQVTSDGNRYLGSAIGTPDYIHGFIQEKANEWCKQIETLSSFARTQPQAAYTTFVRALSCRWTFLCRVLPDASSGLDQLEHAIVTKLLPALTGEEVSLELRRLFAFPCRDGGLGIVNPTSLTTQYASSRAITAALTTNILDQDFSVTEALASVASAKASQRADHRQKAKTDIRGFAADASPTLQHTIQLASEPGASSWLTCRPLSRHGFVLSKSEFRDGLALCYGWRPSRLPSTCVCGASFTVAHALTCSTGGFPSLRHNEVRDITASLLKRVANSVAIEPHLQPLSGEQLRYKTASTEDQARLDVAASGVWGGRFERVFLDIRVFNPFAPSNRSSSITAC